MTSEIQIQYFGVYSGEASVGDLFLPCDASLWQEHVMEMMVQQYDTMGFIFWGSKFSDTPTAAYYHPFLKPCPWLSGCWHWCITLAEEQIQRLLVNPWFSPQGLRWLTENHGQPLVCRNSRCVFLVFLRKNKQTNQILARNCHSSDHCTTKRTIFFGTGQHSLRTPITTSFQDIP